MCRPNGQCGPSGGQQLKTEVKWKVWVKEHSELFDGNHGIFIGRRNGGENLNKYMNDW